MYSLRRRLLLWATIGLLLFLGLMGFVLNQSFEKSVLSNAEDALRNQILLLIANIDVVDDKILAPPLLPEPRLSQVDSDLYAQITMKKEGVTKVLWRSRSLLEKELPHQNSALGSFIFFDSIEHDRTQWRDTPRLFGATLGVEWETDLDNFPFTVQIAEHSTVYLKRLKRYQRQVGLSLLILGSVLIVLLLTLFGWLLKPLNKVAYQVGEIEQGLRERFDEDFPLEVNRLTQSLNQLLNFEEQRIGHQKEVMGNLAHSLKTPIAVLSGLQYSQATEADARQQLKSMQTIIDYQLQSASAVGRRRFVKPIEVSILTSRIIDSLQKVHSEKGLSCHLNIVSGTKFFGDQGDWMELAGNLIDNAFKWAESNIVVNVENINNNDPASNRNSIRIEVDDDGPGIDEQLKNSIIDRGVRLDSQTPGHGIGLHIVNGIVDAYQGELQIESSKQVNSSKGTRFSVILN